MWMDSNLSSFVLVIPCNQDIIANEGYENWNMSHSSNNPTNIQHCGDVCRLPCTSSADFHEQIELKNGGKRRERLIFHCIDHICNVTLML